MKSFQVPRYLAARSAGAHREHKEWVEWTKKVGLYDPTIPALLGHRFNIQFVIAARIFKHRGFILEFIQSAPKMAFLKELLTNDLVIVQLQILGLLDQKITGPLWRVAENLGVIEAGEYHRDFVSFIDACIDDPTRFFSDECPTVSTQPTFELFKVDGTLLKALVTPNPSRLACSVAVRVLRSCAAYLREVLGQTMPGGIYCNPSDEVAQCVKSAPTTNRSVESGFALMDYLYKRAPYMRFYRRDAICCFTLNHVGAWLDGKSTVERTRILEKALERRKEIIRDERKKSDLLGKEIVRKMENDAVQFEQKAQYKETRKSQICKELGEIGLLTTEAEIDRAVLGLGKTNAKSLILKQLRFRKSVLLQQPDSELYRASKGRVKYELDTLVSNLKELVAADNISDENDEENFHHSFLGRACQLDSILLDDDTVLSGVFTVTNIANDKIELNGPSQVTFSRYEFEDNINDGLIFPF